MIAGTFLIVGLGIFLYVYDSVRESNDLTRLDQPLLDWMVANRTPELTSFMQILTNLMGPVAITLAVGISAFIWWRRSSEKLRPLLLILATSLAYATSVLIKNLVERARPAAVDMELPLKIDYSFPSGHTIGVAVVLLVLGYLIYSRAPTRKNLLSWGGVAIAGVTLVAFTRVYLGYHWITDVTASVGLAFVILALIISLDVLRHRSPGKKIAL